MRNAYRYLLMLQAGQERLRDATARAAAGVKTGDGGSNGASDSPHPADINGGPAWTRVGKATGMSQAQILDMKQQHADAKTLDQFRIWFDEHGGNA